MLGVALTTTAADLTNLTRQIANRPDKSNVIQKAAGLDWCGTETRFREKARKAKASLTGCPIEGPPDMATNRDASIPTVATPIKVMRLRFCVFRETDGSNAAATQADVEAQVAQLNADFLPYRIQFIHQTEFINDSRYRYVLGLSAELSGMKSRYVVAPQAQHNVYVASVEAFLGLSTFPWDADALGVEGGTVVHAGTFGAGQKTLTHELGHALGLWHTHHGVSEVEACSDCYERSDGQDGDSTGDFCSDTPPTPRNFDCAPPGGLDSCSGMAWGPTAPQNYMGYGPDACLSEFTPQQAGRFHGWITNQLTGWLFNSSGPAVIVSHPQSQTLLPESSIAFSAVTDGAPPLFYQWWRDGVVLPGETNSVLDLGLVSSNLAGAYHVVVSNGLGFMISSNAVLQVLPTFTFNEALDAGGLWFSGGTRPWIGQNIVSHDGVDAARSGTVGAYGESWLETTVRGPGWLSFWWKVSSETSYDFLRFYLDGEHQQAITGEVDWQQHRRWLEVGNHTLRWSYSKDVNVSIGQDVGWVDELFVEGTNSTIPTRFGDLDGDGRPTVLDLTLLTSYLANTNTLRPQVAVFADVNTNGVINSADVTALANAILGRSTLSIPADTDGDGIPNVLEPLLGLNPLLTNSPGSNMPDRDRDFDGDGLSNFRELQVGTDPLRADTDGDGWRDEAELTVGTSPLDASSRPSVMSVAAPRVALLLPGYQANGGLSWNTMVASPRTALVLPVAYGTTGVSNNTVMASPPTTLVLPSVQGNAGVVFNTTVAQPPTSLLLPADEGAGGLTNNTVVAAPPLALILPVEQGIASLTNNQVIAMPPVRIQLPFP